MSQFRAPSDFINHHRLLNWVSCVFKHFICDKTEREILVVQLSKLRNVFPNCPDQFSKMIQTTFVDLWGPGDDFCAGGFVWDGCAVSLQI